MLLDCFAAIVWMCKNQIGRRNISDEQRTVLIGEAYKAQKMSRGAADGFRGNQHTKVVSLQKEDLPERPQRTCKKIAKQFGVASSTVERAEHFLDGLNAADEVIPGFVDNRDGLLSARGEDFAHPFILVINMTVDISTTVLVPQHLGHILADEPRKTGGAKPLLWSVFTSWPW